MKYGASAKRYIRLLGAVLALVLVAGMLPVRAAENSVLYNGSFDLSNISTQTAPGWGLNPGNPNHTVTIQNNVVYGNTGYALKIEAAGLTPEDYSLTDLYTGDTLGNDNGQVRNIVAQYIRDQKVIEPTVESTWQFFMTKEDAIAAGATVVE